MDVVGLYPSITHGEGLEAIRGALDSRTVPEVSIETLVELASLVLENNYFELNDRVFRHCCFVLRRYIWKKGFT